MKKVIVLILTIICLFGLIGCVSNNDKGITPTGYPSDEVQRQQIMYNGAIYYYTANGFDNQLPDGYTLVGEVQEVDNKHEPTTNWCGSRVDVGQKIYASDSKSNIYLEYETGYAEFTTLSESQ